MRLTTLPLTTFLCTCDRALKKGNKVEKNKGSK
jgi:hypothetical protein